MLGVIDALAIKADHLCDYVPLISSATNLVNLIQKFSIIPVFDKISCIESKYYTHLKEKSAFRCVILLVPLIGNLSVVIYDTICAQKNTPKNLTADALKENMLNTLRENKSVSLLYHADNALKKREDFIFEAFEIIQDVSVFAYADDLLKSNEEFMIKAFEITQNFWVFSYANDLLKSDEEFMIKALEISKNAYLVNYCSNELKKKKEFIIKAFKITQDVSVFNYADDLLKSDEEFMIEALNVSKNLSVLNYCSNELKNSESFNIKILKIMKENSLDGYWRNNKIFENENFMFKAIVDIDIDVLKYADREVKCNFKYMLKVLSKFHNLRVFEYIDEELKNDEEFIDKAFEITKNIDVFKHMGCRWGIQERILKSLQLTGNPAMVVYDSSLKYLRYSDRFMIRAMDINENVANYALGELAKHAVDSWEDNNMDTSSD